jgi:hypothetical protein
MAYNYSPRTIDDYCLPSLGGACEVGSIAKLKRHQAVWNLFWLSVPKIDNVPGAGVQWVQVYRPIADAAAAITTDVLLDEVLYRKLMMHPTSFAAWFEREDHTIYDAYDVLGERAWVDTVLQRASLSAQRMASSIKALEKTDNVFQFLRKVA